MLTPCFAWWSCSGPGHESARGLLSRQARRGRRVAPRSRADSVEHPHCVEENTLYACGSDTYCRVSTLARGGRKPEFRISQLVCRRRTSAATAATSTGPVVSTVISGPMPTGRSYLSIAASGSIRRWTSCLDRALYRA